MKKFSWRFAVPLLACLILFGFLARGLQLDPRRVESPLIGQPAPAFSLPALGGDQLLTQEHLAEKPSLFNVWASWCVSCRAEHAILVELAENQGLRIFGLNYKDDEQEAIAWLGRLGDPYVASGRDVNGRVGIDWGVYGVPETFVVDHNGIVVEKHIGPLSWDYVNTKLLPLMAELKQNAR